MSLIGLPGPIGEHPDDDTPLENSSSPDAVNAKWTNGPAGSDSATCSNRTDEREEKSGTAADRYDQARNRRGPGSDSGTRHRARRRPDKRHIPSRSAVMASLASLPPLLLAHIISPAVGSAMKSIFQTLLANLPEEGSAAGSSSNTASLRDAIRRQPELLDALAPLLSDEQLNELVDDVKFNDENDAEDDHHP